jgi:8-oxo-dGTP pyrophosphatase MutT (NUDIX family)
MTMTKHSSSSHRIVRGLLDRVKHNDRAGTAARSAVSFMIGNSSQTPLGLVLPEAANEFSKFPSLFSVNENEVRLLDRSEWFGGGNKNDDGSFLVTKRSEALREVLETMRDDETVPALGGWRNEAFSVRESFHSPPFLIVERAAAVLFGVPAYGVFVNGYTCEEQDHQNRRPTHVWVGRRSPTKQTWPGRLDSLAAGGLGAGVLPRQAILNECAEEAGIDASYLEERIKAVSAVSYTGFNDDMWGLKRDVLFCFDLELPQDFEPVPVDGEMESFEKIPINRLMELLAEPIRNEDDSDNLWKPNVGVVLIDFLVRHGILDADDPCFLELIDALRGAKCA